MSCQRFGNFGIPAFNGRWELNRNKPQKFLFQWITYELRWIIYAQIKALPEEVDGNNLLRCEQKLISKLYMCLGDKGQKEFHSRWPHMDFGATQYPTVVGALEEEFKKEWNEFTKLSGYCRGATVLLASSSSNFIRCIAGLQQGAVLAHWKTGY